MDPRIWLVCGAVLGGLGVITGAYGAHGLEKKLTADTELANSIAASGETSNREADPTLAVPRLLGSYEVAVRYQMYHALALLLVGVLARISPQTAWTIAGLLLLAGVLVFSGSLYALVFTRVKMWGAVTPIGGLLLIVGWLAVAIGAWRSS